MSNRRLVSVAAVSTSGTAYTGRADGLFSTNDQAKLKQAGNWPTAIKAPSAPTAASATAGSLQATVSFTTPSSLNGETITSYTVTSSPGSVTATGASSPITVSGLTANTSYTFTVVANTASGASLSSSASSSVTVLNVAYSDDVFSTYLYTGNSSTQTIVNGINLAGQGGLVWRKIRSSADHHRLSNTVTGTGRTHFTNLTNAMGTGDAEITSFNSNGFTMGNSDGNLTGSTYTAWTFRKAANFFDIVAWTGNGAGTAKTHNLGVVPGMLIVKATSTDSFTDANDWMTWHNGMGSGSFVNSPAGGNWPCAAKLNSTAGYGVYNGWCSVSSSTFNPTYHNTAGVTYVAYLFAHDPSPTGNIQCGSFVPDGSNNADVTLGWEPQYLLWKKADGIAEWNVIDTMRGFSNSPPSYLRPNNSDAEFKSGSSYVAPTAAGFAWRGVGSGNPIIYMAIRRPNKPPTSGAQVFNVNTISFGGAIGL